MEHGNLFAELSLVIAIGAGISALMRIFKQPLLIGYIITGIIVGPLLGLIGNAETLEGFSKIGIALLLFIVGLGLNPRIIKDLGKISVVAGLNQVIVSTIVGTVVMLLIGRSLVEGLVVGGALAFSSTIVGLKLLTDKKELSRLYGQLSVGTLLVQDILAMLALIVLSAQSQGFSFGAISMLILKGLLVAIPTFLISNKVLSKFSKFISGSQEFLFLAATAWGFGIAALFQWAGFSLEIGALVAGVCLASMPYAQEVSSRLRPVRDFFIIIFFIFLGINLNIAEMIEMLPMALLFSLFVLIANPLAIMLPIGLFGHTKRNAFKVGVMMAQIGEFSLIFTLLAKENGLIDSALVSMITLVSLITIAVSCYMISYDDEIFEFLQKRIRFFESKHPEKHESRHQYDIVLFGYKKGGSELLKVFKKLQGKKVIVIDYDPEAIEELEQKDINHMLGDATDIELLSETGAETARLIVATMTNIETSRFLLSFLREHNPSAVVILHAASAKDAAELYELGANYVMIPHLVGGERLASFIERHGFKKKEFDKHREKHMSEITRALAPLNDDQSTKDQGASTQNK